LTNIPFANNIASGMNYNLRHDIREICGKFTQWWVVSS